MTKLFVLVVLFAAIMMVVVAATEHGLGTTHHTIAAARGGIASSRRGKRLSARVQRKEFKPEEPKKPSNEGVFYDGTEEGELDDDEADRIARELKEHEEQKKNIHFKRAGVHPDTKPPIDDDNDANFFDQKEAESKYRRKTPDGVEYYDGMCETAVAKKCRGLTYAYSEFILCAVRKAEELFGPKEDTEEQERHICHEELIEHVEPCAKELVKFCPDMDSDRALKCFRRPEIKDSISTTCVQSNFYESLGNMSELEDEMPGGAHYDAMQDHHEQHTDHLNDVRREERLRALRRMSGEPVGEPKKMEDPNQNDPDTELMGHEF